MTDQVTDNPIENPSDNPTLSAEDLLATIKAGDGRQKYSSTEDALKSIEPAQTHITALEADNEAMKTELAELKHAVDKQESMEDLVAKMLARREPDAPASEDGEPAKQLSAEELQAAIALSITNMEKTKTEDTNAASVVDNLTKALGTAQAVKDKMAQAARELGMPVEGLYAMTKTSPASVYKLLGVDIAKVAAAPVEKLESTVNPLTLKNNPVVEKKSAMGIGTTTQDMLNAWRAHAPKQE